MSVQQIIDDIPTLESVKITSAFFDPNQIVSFLQSGNINEDDIKSLDSLEGDLRIKIEQYLQLNNDNKLFSGNLSQNFADPANTDLKDLYLQVPEAYAVLKKIIQFKNNNCINEIISKEEEELKSFSTPPDKTSVNGFADSLDEQWRDLYVAKRNQTISNNDYESCIARLSALRTQLMKQAKFDVKFNSTTLKKEMDHVEFTDANINSVLEKLNLDNGARTVILTAFNMSHLLDPDQKETVLIDGYNTKTIRFLPLTQRFELLQLLNHYQTTFPVNKTAANIRRDVEAIFNQYKKYIGEPPKKYNSEEFVAIQETLIRAIA